MITPQSLQSRPEMVPVPPNSLAAALAYIKADGRLCVPSAVRTYVIDQKAAERFEKAGAWLLKEDGNGYRLRTGKSSVYLFPGQLQAVIDRPEQRSAFDGQQNHQTTMTTPASPTPSNPKKMPGFESTPLAVYPTANVDTPEYIHAYQDDVIGAGGVVRGIDDVLTGKAQVASWMIAKKTDVATHECCEVVSIALGRDSYGKCMRITSADNDPDGANSESLVIGGLDVSLDRAYLAAKLVERLTLSGLRYSQDARIFRAVPAKNERADQTARAQQSRRR